MTLRSGRRVLCLKLGRHEVKQILPTGTEPVAGQGLQIVEESLPYSQQGTDVLIVQNQTTFSATVRCDSWSQPKCAQTRSATS